MTKYVIDFINLSNGVKHRISNDEFLNKTTAQQVLYQKLTRYERAGALITERADDYYFCYKAGCMDFMLRIEEV